MPSGFVRAFPISATFPKICVACLDWSHHGQDEQHADELPHLKSLRTVGLPKAAIYNKAAGSAIRFAAAIMSAASAGEFAQRRTTTVMRMRG